MEKEKANVIDIKVSTTELDTAIEKAERFVLKDMEIKI